MRRAVAVLMAAAALAGCAAVDPDAPLRRRVDATIAPLVDARQFSGAVVLMRGGRVVYQRGFGLANHEVGLAFTPDTPSDGASLAKTLTAAGLWGLVHEGRVDLDAPVARTLPEFPHPRTTVRQLLAHSNGLPPYYEFFDPHFGPDDIRTTAALLRVVAREWSAPSFEPGTRFEYSNLGYDVAGLLIERVTGLDYEAYMRQRFFAPLGMDASFARPARLADWRGVRTRGYRWRGGGWQPFDVFDGEAFLGASNLYLSAKDLARWAQAQAAGTALPPPAFAAGRQRSLIAGRPSAIDGLSWYCDDAGERCWYTGSLNAFHGFAYWDRRRGEVAAFVSNSALPARPVIDLQRALVDALAGRAEHAVPMPALERFDRRSRPAVAGEYVDEELGTLSVVADGARLSLSVNAGLVYEVFQVERDAFYVPGLDWWLAFSGGSPPGALQVRSMLVDRSARRR